MTPLKQPSCNTLTLIQY